jgi:co-chaperonin GroES (HSP10)
MAKEDGTNYTIRSKRKDSKREPEPKDEPKVKIASRIPVPCGYKMLVALPQADEMTDGGIAKAEETKRIEEIGSVCGFVVKMGPDCYKDTDRFPSGAYCKEGDWVVMRSYSGTRFAIDGEEVRLINDDSVEAVVDDPRGIAKR